MKFGKYLEKQAKDEWRQFYLDYKGLKDLIKESAQEAATSGPAAFSPRTTSLSIARAAKKADASEERFFQKLEQEVRGAARWAARGAVGRAATVAAARGALQRARVEELLPQPPPRPRALGGGPRRRLVRAALCFGS